MPDEKIVPDEKRFVCAGLGTKLKHILCCYLSTDTDVHELSPSAASLEME